MTSFVYTTLEQTAAWDHYFNKQNAQLGDNSELFGNQHPF